VCELFYKKNIYISFEKKNADAASVLHVRPAALMRVLF
jgi:hypothetical protein